MGILPALPPHRRRGQPPRAVSTRAGILSSLPGTGNSGEGTSRPPPPQNRRQAKPRFPLSTQRNPRPPSAPGHRPAAFVGGPTRAVSLPLLRSRPLVAVPAGTTGPPENRAEPLPSTAWGAGTFPDPAKNLILEVGFAGVGCLGLAGAAVVLCKQTLLSTEMLNSKEHLRPTITPIYPKNTDDMHGARTLPCPRVPYGPGFPPTPAIQLLDP